MRLILKGCARCGGDLVPDFSGLEEVLVCLQCGAELPRRRYIARLRPLDAEPEPAVALKQTA
jgi:hypothetical protein